MMCGVAVKFTVSGTRQPKFTSQRHHLFPVQPWTKHRTALCFGLNSNNTTCCLELLGGLHELIRGKARTVADSGQYSVTLALTRVNLL